jgi:hypothetical protein
MRETRSARKRRSVLLLISVCESAAPLLRYSICRISGLPIMPPITQVPQLVGCQAAGDRSGRHSATEAMEPV